MDEMNMHTLSQTKLVLTLVVNAQVLHIGYDAAVSQSFFTVPTCCK